jgi:hypothetical protein
MPLQRIFSISGVTENKTNYLMKDGSQEFLLKPMTIKHATFSYIGDTEDMLERFDVISYSAPLTYDPYYIEGDLWLHVTAGSLKDPQAGNIYVVVNQTWALQLSPDANPLYFDGYRETFVTETDMNYGGAKQVLSTPFLFYFGLRPEKTALDMLIKYFGPKDAFLLSERIPCPNPGATPTPSSTPALSRLPILMPTPTPTPTPSISSGSLGFSYRGNLWACSGGACGSYINNIAIHNFQALSEGYFYKLPGGGQIIEITAPNPLGGGSSYVLWDGDRWSTCDGACSS